MKNFSVSIRKVFIKKVLLKNEQNHFKKSNKSPKLKANLTFQALKKCVKIEWHDDTRFMFNYVADSDLFLENMDFKTLIMHNHD